MAACPKCGGTSGYRFEMTETHVMSGTWEGEESAGDSGLNVRVTRPACFDCGHTFQWATLKKMQQPESPA